MDWINQNLIEALLIIGMLLLGIEVLVLGFSTFVLFFVGVAALITAALIYVDAIPATMLGALFSLGVFSALGALFLWKPLKKMQSSVEKNQVHNDFIGLRFTLDEDLGQGQIVKYRYSGIDWQLQSDRHIKAGTEVQVIGTEVGIFHVTDQSVELEE